MRITAVRTNCYMQSLSQGELDAPACAGGRSSDTTILKCRMLGELYVNFSLSKINDKKYSFLKGPIQDLGLLLGINMAADAKVVKYLPGLRLSWNLPGFAFLNSYAA